MLAVDPGFYNYAVAVLDMNTRSLLFSVVACVRKDQDGDVATAENICALLRPICDAWQPSQAVIEHQGMSQVLRGVENATIGCLVALGIPTAVVFPQTIKSHFGTALGFHGHKQNKKDAELLVQQLQYGFHVNHVADCILMCLVWLDRNGYK